MLNADTADSGGSRVQPFLKLTDKHLCFSCKMFSYTSSGYFVIRSLLLDIAQFSKLMNEMRITRAYENFY